MLFCRFAVFGRKYIIIIVIIKYQNVQFFIILYNQEEFDIDNKSFRSYLKSGTETGKNTMTTTENTPELLYFGYGTTPSHGIHSHIFYQIEFCVSGDIPCRKNSEILTLKQGEFWLIPPGVHHRFLKGNSPYRYITLKFDYNGNIPEFRGSDPACRNILESVQNIIQRNSELEPHSPAAKFVIENAINGILNKLKQLNGSSGQEPDLLNTIRSCVGRDGYAVDINYLAGHLHLTRSQLHYRFAKSIGNNSNNIRNFVEDVLVNIAEKHLRYSPMNISEIANELKFPSIFCFSRFYKRKCGISPLELRRKLKEARDNTY